MKSKSKECKSRKEAREKIACLNPEYKKLKYTHLVHHMDKNPLNNSTENLKLIGRSEHANFHKEEIKKARNKIKTNKPKQTDNLLINKQKIKKQIMVLLKESQAELNYMVDKAFEANFIPGDWKKPETHIMSKAIITIWGWKEIFSPYASTTKTKIKRLANYLK